MKEAEKAAVGRFESALSEARERWRLDEETRREALVEQIRKERDAEEFKVAGSIEPV